MSEKLRRTKKKMEHWKVVTFLLIAYDFLAVILSFLQRYGCGLTVILVILNCRIYRCIITQF